MPFPLHCAPGDAWKGLLEYGFNEADVGQRKSHVIFIVLTSFRKKASFLFALREKLLAAKGP